MRNRLEIVAVATALLLHFLLTRVVGIPGLDIAPLTVGALAYACVQGRDAEVRAQWGTRRGGFAECAVAVVPLLVVGIGTCASIGWHRGFLAADTHLLLTVLLYAAWGTAQQFLLLSLLANALDRLRLPRVATLTLVTLGFAAAHVPNWPQVAATAVLGGWCAALFFRHRNLWPLGLAHGLLGALFYRWVLGVDVCTALFTQR